MTTSPNQLSSDDELFFARLRQMGLTVSPKSAEMRNRLPRTLAPDGLAAESRPRLVRSPLSSIGDVLEGQQGKYQLGQMLHGAGKRSSVDLSQVFEAVVVGHQEPTVVVKVPNGQHRDARLLTSRFRDESQRMLKLRDCCHWIMRLVDWGETPEGVPFQVFPKYEGTLRQRILPVESPASETFPACLLSVLDFLHNELRLFHVDIKPDNLLIAQIKNSWGGKLETLILADLGASLPLDAEGRGAVPWAATDEYAPGASRRPGFLWDMRAELHCVAVTLCEMLTGRRPARDAEENVKKRACATLFASAPLPTATQRWGEILDRAVAGEFSSVRQLRDAAQLRGLLLTNDAEHVLESSQSPWVAEGMLKWLQTAVGAALAGLCVGGTLLADEPDLSTHLDGDDSDIHGHDHDEDDPGHDLGNDDDDLHEDDDELDEMTADDDDILTDQHHDFDHGHD